MTRVNFTLLSSFQTLKCTFKIFHLLTAVHWNYFVRACIQNIYAIYIIFYRKCGIVHRNDMHQKEDLIIFYSKKPKIQEFGNFQIIVLCF